MSEAVQVQMILVFGTIMVAVVTTVGLIAVALINRTRQHAKAASDNTAVTRHAITNDHPTNFRDDLDEKFEEVFRLLGIHGRQINRLFVADSKLAADLEATRPKTPRKRTYTPKENPK